MQVVHINSSICDMEIKIPGVDHLAEGAKYFLQKVITPPLEEVGGLLADQVRSWRFNNQIKIIYKAENLLKEKGIRTKKVSLKVLAPLLEHASMEEDESLQDKWAHLLANTVRESGDGETTLFIHVLAQLSSSDAAVFEAIYAMCTETKKSERISHVTGQPSSLTITLQKPMSTVMEDTLQKMFTDPALNIDNLYRLRLIRPAGGISGQFFESLMTLSDLGFRFMSAVRGPQ